MKKKEIIEKRFLKNNNYITSKNLSELDINSTFLYNFVKEKQLTKITKGFYASDDWFPDDELIFQYNHPKCIFSHQSALWYHNLTDKIPYKKEVTVYNEYKINKANIGDIKVRYVSKKIYSLGIIEFKNGLGNILMIYDPERTICDIIKDRNNYDTDIVLSAIRAYNKSPLRNINKLFDYAQKMNIKNKVKGVFEVIAYDY